MKHWRTRRPSAFAAPGGLGVGFCFSKAGHAVAILPLTTFLQDGDTFKAFENVAFATGIAGGAETAML